jgi:hypothetical protein
MRHPRESAPGNDWGLDAAQRQHSSGGIEAAKYGTARQVFQPNCDDRTPRPRPVRRAIIRRIPLMRINTQRIAFLFAAINTLCLKIR